MVCTTSSEGSAFSSDVLALRYQPSPRRPLPLRRNIAGRPVWEPPVLDYSDLIEKEYEQKRKAMLRYYRNDVAMATAWLDLHDEDSLLYMYADSVLDELSRASSDRDEVRVQFFAQLNREIAWSEYEVDDIVKYNDNDMNLQLERRLDGTYGVIRLFDGQEYEVEDYLEEIDPDSDPVSEVGGYVLTSSTDIGSGTSGRRDEDGAEQSPADTPTSTTEPIDQADDHILDSRSAVEELELAFLSPPTSTPHNPAPNTPPPSSIDESQDADEASTQMDLLSLWW